MKPFIILFFIISFVSCDTNFSAPKPDNLLENQQMEDILYDIKFLAAAKSKKYKILKDNNVKVDSLIYQKYKIDSTTLHQNIAYYSTHSLKTYKEMEHNIQLRFEAERKKIGTALKEKDSVRLAKKKKEIQQRNNKGEELLKSTLDVTKK